MATENPKVSGYVPQEIFDCLLDFKEKRSLKSVSLALTVVLSEYFQVDQKVNHQSSLLSGDDFVSKKQFEDLENKISELPNNLLSELNRIVDEKIGIFRHELLYGSLKLVEAEVVEVESEPQGDSNHLQLDLIETALDNKDLEIDSQSSQHIPEQSNFTLSEPSNSIGTKLLARRLNVRPETISKKKKGAPEQELYNWIKDKDPDKISWQPAGGSLKGYSKGWTPAEDTPSKLLGRLKEWVDTNPE